jgi:hypothetical protein
VAQIELHKLCRVEQSGGVPKRTPRFRREGSQDPALALPIVSARLKEMCRLPWPAGAAGREVGEVVEEDGDSVEVGRGRCFLENQGFTPVPFQMK